MSILFPPLKQHSMSAPGCRTSCPAYCMAEGSVQNFLSIGSLHVAKNTYFRVSYLPFLISFSNSTNQCEPKPDIYVLVTLVGMNCTETSVISMCNCRDLSIMSVVEISKSSGEYLQSRM